MQPRPMELGAKLREITRKTAARRVAAIILVAGLAWVVVRLLHLSPVESSVVVVLEGEWPAVEGVTLTYTEPGGGEVLREVRIVGPGREGGIRDSVSLSPGVYSVQVVVETSAGASTFHREIDHGSGAVNRLALRR